MNWDMYDSDAGDIQFERHQEKIRRDKRIVDLVNALRDINPTVDEARTAWTIYKNG